MRKIAIEKLPALLGLIAEKSPLYLPVDTKTGAEFRKYESGMTPSNALLTTRSAKDTFFPQSETLMNFMVDGKTIKENDIMGIGDKTILAVGSKIEDTTLEMVAEMMKETDAELLSVYYGEDIKEAEAEGLQKALEEAYPDCDVELQYGGQPIYYYVISAE